MSLKTLLDYQLSSGGKVSIPLETIREYIMEELQSTQSHQSICRVLETLTGFRVESTEDKDIKCIYGGNNP